MLILGYINCKLVHSIFSRRLVLKQQRKMSVSKTIRTLSVVAVLFVFISLTQATEVAKGRNRRGLSAKELLNQASTILSTLPKNRLAINPLIGAITAALTALAALIK